MLGHLLWSVSTLAVVGEKFSLPSLEIDTYLSVADPGEAYAVLMADPASVVLGGCGYLRLGQRRISTAIDLSQLGLSFIRQTGGVVEIGAMTSLRAIETAPLIQTVADGVLAASIKHIVGVQFRQIATIGGSVAGRFAFSDPLTALLAVDCRLVFQHHGEIDLASYLAGKGLRDILLKIVIGQDGRRAAFASLRRSATDYSVLNVAVSRLAERYRLVVGSRPGRALQCEQAEQFLADNGLDARTAVAAGQLAAQHLRFGDNPRASAEYRKAICPVLVRRALEEVMDAT